MRKFYMILALVMVWASIPMATTVWGISWQVPGKGQSAGQSQGKKSSSGKKTTGLQSDQQTKSLVTFGMSGSNAGQDLLSALNKGDSGEPQDSWAALAAGVQKKCQAAERSCILRLARVTKNNNSFPCYQGETPKSSEGCKKNYPLIPFDFLKAQFASGKGIEGILKQWDVELEPSGTKVGKQLPASLIADCVQQLEMGGNATCEGLGSCDTKQPLHYSYADLLHDAGQPLHTAVSKFYPARQYVAGCAQENYVFQCVHPSTYPFQVEMVWDFGALVAAAGKTLNEIGAQQWPGSDLLVADGVLDIPYCKTDGTFTNAKFPGLWMAKVARPVALGKATHRVLCGIGKSPPPNANEVLKDTGKYPLEQVLDKNYCSPVPDLPGMEICLLAVHSQPVESFQEECSFDYVIRPL